MVCQYSMTISAYSDSALVWTMMGVEGVRVYIEADDTAMSNGKPLNTPTLQKLPVGGSPK